MKVIVLHDFFDKEDNLALRKEGESLEVSAARAKYLVGMGFARIVKEQEGGDLKFPEKAQG